MAGEDGRDEHGRFRGKGAARKVGRPTKYSEKAFPHDTVRDVAANGLTNEEIAHELGIGLTTLKEWMPLHPEFAAAIKAGKEIADERVEGKLYRRAMGYQYEERERVRESAEMDLEAVIAAAYAQGVQVQVVEPEGEARPKRRRKVKVPAMTTKTVVLQKEAPPDTKAQIFWLTNRQRERWKNRQDTEHSGEVKVPVDLSGLTSEQLEAIATGALRGKGEDAG